MGWKATLPAARRRTALVPLNIWVMRSTSRRWAQPAIHSTALTTWGWLKVARSLSRS